MKRHDQKFKEQVISDYLSGGGTYRDLQDKYGVDFRLIHQWVKSFKGGNTTQKKVKHKVKEEKPQEDLPREVKQLQDELRQAKLYNKLLEALVDIGKEKYGIDLRKKNGTKQS